MLLVQAINEPTAKPDAGFMLDHSPSAPPPFALDTDQIAVRDMARHFADEVFAPNAVAWDEARHFPVAEMRKAAVAATAPFDCVLSPTAPMTAFPAEWPSPSRDPLHPFPHIGFTVAYNMSEQPAASVNCGYDSEGLPIGLQIIGRRFDDVGVLAIARAVEAIRAFDARPWPEPPQPDQTPFAKG